MITNYLTRADGINGYSKRKLICIHVGYVYSTKLLLNDFGSHVWYNLLFNSYINHKRKGKTLDFEKLIFTLIELQH